MAYAIPEPFPTSGDGSFLVAAREIQALALADDFTPYEAWVLARGEPPERSKRRNWEAYRRPIERSPSFQARVAKLKAEKEEMVADPYGEAKWAALQTWRVARLANDVSIMLRAAELLFKIEEYRPGSPDAPAPAAVTEEKASPGRPATKSPLNRRDPSDIRQKLLEKGAGEPETGDDDDD